MSTLAHLLLAMLAFPAAAACSYLLVLTLFSARLPIPAASSRSTRFDVIVPAHNEAATLSRCLASLRDLDWPADRVRVLVIADNCTDDTAALARAANAEVLERFDSALRGKGYALQRAFNHSRDDGWADAVVVVDADTEVSTNLLEAFAARIEAGAGAVQAHYGVLNPEQSWRTRLMAIAHGAFHGVRSRARERLKVSCGLRGNGWCATHGALDAVRYRAFSVTEDLEYGIALGLAGHRVHYAAEAQVRATMESGEAVARRQRQRWEDGRFGLIRSQTLPLLRAALQRRSAVCLDLALDLLVLPLAYVVLNLVVLLAAAGALTWWQQQPSAWLGVAMVSATGLVLYVLRGWQLSGRGAAGLLDLLLVPFFIVWKLRALIRRHDRDEWAPTPRQTPMESPVSRHVP